MERFCASAPLIFNLAASAQTYNVVHTFGILSNATGINPGGLIQGADGTLYGTCSSEGDTVHASGTVFKLNTDGTGFTTVYTFADGNDGAIPTAGLVQAGGAFLGTASAGGNLGDGVVFSLGSTSPRLNFQAGNRALVLSWNSPGFSLQAAPPLTGVFTNVPGASSPYTNFIPGTRDSFG
jgi:hypothetical protein